MHIVLREYRKMYYIHDLLIVNSKRKDEQV